MLLLVLLLTFCWQGNAFDAPENAVVVDLNTTKPVPMTKGFSGFNTNDRPFTPRDTKAKIKITWS